MTAAEIVQQLKPLGSESIKKVLLKHGIQEPLFGVKVAELKKIQKGSSRITSWRSTYTTQVSTTPCTLLA